MYQSLKRATRKQLNDFLVDCMGYREEDTEEWSTDEMRMEILQFEQRDNQGDQFAGYTY